MPRASATAENAALDGIFGTGNTNTGTHHSLHVADPGTTGASENANSGGYARQALTMNAASSGIKTNSNTLTYSTGGTVPVTHGGTWNSATYAGGTYSIGNVLASSVTAASITFAPGSISYSAT